MRDSRTIIVALAITAALCAAGAWAQDRAPAGKAAAPAAAAQAPAAAAQAPAAAGALSGPDLYQQRTCIACHGKDAKTPVLPDYPKLAGQNSAYLLRQMQDIKTGARANGNTAAMKGVMHLVNDDELKTLADWLATQR